MDGFQNEIAARLPVAESLLQILSYATEDTFLTGVFARHRGRSYESELTFGTIVNVIGDALLEHDGSGHRAIRQAKLDQDITVSMEAVYGKLRRIPQSLSHGFLREVTQRLTAIQAETPSPVPQSLQEFDVLAVDGKKLKNVAKRLSCTRSFKGKVFGGKGLVALDLRTKLAVALSSHLDGEKNDIPLVPDLFEQLENIPRSKSMLLVFDRQFCDLHIPVRVTTNGHHYLIRYHQKVTFTRDEKHKVRRGRDRDGRHFIDERGWLGAENNRLRLYVRRITLLRPGEEDVSVLTDLMDEKYLATDLLDLYDMRWGIEKVFQVITDVFHLRQMISTTPAGTIFQFAFCLTLYNVLQVQRSYLAAAQSLTPEQISLENLFTSVHRQLTTWAELLPPVWTIKHFEKKLSAPSVVQRLHELLDQQWKPEWMKSPKKKRSPQTRAATKSGGHTSIYRLINKPKQT
jgi:hypothetical protein